MSSQLPQPTGASSDVVRRLLLDSALAVALVGILVVVYGFDLAIGSFWPKVSSTDKNGDSTELVVQETEHVETTDVPESKPLRLAVTPAQFDDMGQLLDKLGDGYKYSVIQLDQLRNREVLDQYDVIFLTCGTDPESWMGQALGGGTGERNSRSFMMREDAARELRENLHGFVQRGGTLYASDWRFNLIRLAFPEFVGESADRRGAAQEVDAQVVDDGLRELIGDRIQLRFDLGEWYPAAFTGHAVKHYLQGNFQTMRGAQVSSPLLVKFSVGEGTVLFTSFHNEKQNSEKELALLKYLVFTTVTARVESKIKETMVKGGFSPQKQSLLSTSKEAPTVSKTYECKKAGHLQFVLAFENQGARLHLEIVGPDGRKIEKEDVATIKIDVNDATVGQWKYTVTAKKVPYENFPFTLTVWQK